MGQIVVRNLDDDVVERLKRRAMNQKKSLEQTVRDILTESVKPSRADLLADIDAIRDRMPACDKDTTTAIIRAWRDGDEIND